jgi:hypothetical protein
MVDGQASLFFGRIVSRADELNFLIQLLVKHPVV